MHKLQHSLLLNQNFHAEPHLTSFIKFLQSSHLIIIDFPSSLDLQMSAMPISFSLKPEPCCSFTWKNVVCVITGEVFCGYYCHWNPWKIFLEMKKAGSRPIGGQEFLQISLMKISNYSTPEGIIPNRESYLESSLAGYSILLLEHL